SVVWLREFLKSYKGGLIVISHDVKLVGGTVNRVFYLDANRQVIDLYNMGWRHYQRQRVADEERRKKERPGAEKKASAPGQPASTTCARPIASRTSASRSRRPAARRRSWRRACRSRTARSRSSPASTWRSTAVRRSWCSASTARARPPCCASSRASTRATPDR